MFFWMGGLDIDILEKVMDIIVFGDIYGEDVCNIMEGNFMKIFCFV